jgi:hypothetical protein
MAIMLFFLSCHLYAIPRYSTSKRTIANKRASMILTIDAFNLYATIEQLLLNSCPKIVSKYVEPKEQIKCALAL